MNSIKRYDAYLTFRKITDDQQDSIRRIFDAQGLDIDLFEDALEFCFEGRDVSNKVVAAFSRIALILEEASGEIRCEIDDDGSQDPTFEFYTVADSYLWKQAGRIVRAEQKSRIDC